MADPAFVLLQDRVVQAQAQGDLVVPWWSFGKTLIAAAALRLADQGRLSLDRPLGAFSLRQLLRHEAGLTDYGALEAYHQAVAAGEAPWSRADMLERAQAERLNYPPGTGWAYSNIGYLKVRELIEDAQGAELGQAVRSLVYEPLGLEGGRLAQTQADLTGVEMGTARGYHPGWVYHGLFVGPLSQAAALLDGISGEASLLSALSRGAMREAHALPQYASPPWTAPAYGLGLMCPMTDRGWQVLGHTGGGPGSHVAVYHGPDTGRTAAVFAPIDQQGVVESIAVALLADERP